MNDLDIAIETAWAYLGRPYHWGGDDPMEGFDCSGFVIELLKSAGLLPEDGDWTAEGLYQYFKDREVTKPEEGCLVFFCGLNTKAFHIEFCLNGEFSIGASAGGSDTQTPEDAIKQNAYIKVRPIHRGNALLKFVNPF